MNKTNRRTWSPVTIFWSTSGRLEHKWGCVVVWQWDGFIVFIFICIISWGGDEAERQWRFPGDKDEGGHGEHVQTALNITSALYVSIYISIFSVYFEYSFKCRHILLWKQDSAMWVGGEVAVVVVVGGGSIYILEWCLHNFKSYVSCLQVKVWHFIYLLLSWSHSGFNLFNQKVQKQTNKKNLRGIFLLFLPRTLLYSSISNNFYLYTYKWLVLNA